jgi:aminocarboxymuconate-semialdehyde decarboxylase
MNHLFTCNKHAPLPGESAGISVRHAGRTRVIDIHCHLGVPQADALAIPQLPGTPAFIRFSSPPTREVNRNQAAALASKLNGVHERIADMDRLGIDIQAISPSPGQYHYELEPELGLEVARLINNRIAEAVASHPDRLVGMGSVPLQAPELATRELHRCVDELGFRGIEISTHVAGRELSDPAFVPFFAAAEARGVLIFMHPLGFSHGERLSDHYLNNLIGNPLESAIAVAHLIFGGTLDRHPRLHICVAHGGGYLPGYFGRLDHGWRARADCRQHITRPPSEYLHRLYFDTLVFDPAQLDFLVRTYGADHLCLGSDYPFDMSEPDPVGFHARLSPQDRAQILGGTAAKLLGLD